MTIRTRVLDWLFPDQKATRTSPAWDIGQRKPIPVDYQTLVTDGYRRNELVFACIRFLAQAAATPKLQVWTGDTQAGDNHPLVQLLETPNPEMSLYDLIEATVVILNIAGDCYWEKERARNGKTLALWPMRSDRVKTVPGAQGIDHYTYEVSGLPVQELPAEDVVHFQYYDPLNEWHGLSPLVVCARAVDSDNERTEYTRQFFLNAAVPYGLLKTKQKLVDTEAERIRRKWQAEYGGSDNWHRVAVLDQDAEYQRLGLTQEEMAFPDLTELTESRICTTFRVSPILINALVGLKQSKYSNYEGAEESFWRGTLMPTVRKLTSTMNLQLAEDYGAEIRADYSEVKALQPDRDAAFTRATGAVSAGWFTVNQALAEVGEEPVKQGDVFLRPMMLTEVPSNGAEAKALPVIYALPQGYALPGAAPAALTQGQQREKNQPASNLLQGWQDERDAQQKAANRTEQIARAHELAFLREAQRLFREERNKLLAVIGRRKRRSKDWLDIMWPLMLEVLDGMKGLWIEAFIPLFTAVIAEQAEVLEAQLGISFAIERPEVQAFIQQYSFKFAEKIGATTIEGVRDLVSRSQAEGWAIPELQKQLQELYGGWDTLRAEMIARTETIRSSNYAAKEAYKQAGYTELLWVAAKDDRMCPYCEALHGTVVGIEENFLNLGDEFQPEGVDRPLKVTYENVEAPPAHVDCRCTIVGVQA